MRELEFVELLGAIQRRVMRRLARHFEAEGLSVTDGLVLKWVSKRGSCRVSEIVDFSSLPASTVTGVLDRLVAGGWLERSSDPEDRRAVIMSGTPKLKEAMRVFQRSVAKALEKSLKGLSPGLLEGLIRDLAEVNACLEVEEEARK